MTDRAKYWQRMVEAWQASGLTQAEFCRRRGLKAANFSWWKRRLGQTAGHGAGSGQGGRGAGRKPGTTGRKSGTKQSRPCFVEVALPDAGLAPGRPPKPTASDVSQCVMYRVVLPGGTAISLPADFDVDKAARLIQALARSC